MKTEKQIKAKLRLVKRAIRKSPSQYDYASYSVWWDALEWVLEEEK